jgi:VanZ family protein
MPAFFFSPLFTWIRRLQFPLAIVIFTYYALLPGSQVHLTVSDKTVHFLGNATLYISAWAALGGRFRLLLLVSLLIPYSLFIELCQYFSPGRTVDIRDMVANVCGLWIGFCLAFLLEKLALWTGIWPLLPAQKAQ